MSKNIYITKTHITDSNESELDFVLHDEFGFDYDKFDDIVTISKGKYGSADATPMKIDDMIQKLNDLKSKGVTHIQIEDHCDHQGYDVSGYEIRLSTDEEIIEIEEKKRSQEEKRLKIQNLQKEIEKVKKS